MKISPFFRKIQYSFATVKIVHNDRHGADEINKVVKSDSRSISILKISE